MVRETDRDAEDDWQRRLDDAPYLFGSTLRELNDTNPWPEYPVLGQAINRLATELWDRSFSVSEIKAALENAAADLPRYAAGEEVRR